MRRRRGSRPALAGSLVLLLTVVSLLQPAAIVAQTGQTTGSQVVGTTTVQFTADWQPQPTTGSVPQVMLAHQSLTDTLYLYTEYEVGPNDEASAIVSAFAVGFFGELGQGTEELLTVGGTTSIIDNVETRLSWELYSITLNGAPYGVLLAADTFSQPSLARISVLVAPEGAFDRATQAVLDGITLNGERSPLVGMDPQDLSEDLVGTDGPAGPTAAATEASGGLTLPPLNPQDTTPAATEPATQPPAEATATPGTSALQPIATEGAGGLTLPPLNATEPADATATESSGGLALPPLEPTGTAAPEESPTSAAGGLQLPPLDATTTPAAGGEGGTVTAGPVEIRYTDDWTLDEENSTPGETIFLDVATGELQFYGLLVQEDAGLDAATALMVLQDIYFDGTGATGVQELAVEEPSQGKAWSLHAAEFAGFPVQVLIYVDTVATPGQVQYHLLVSDPESMPDVLALAGQTLQVGGAPAFSEVDPAIVAGQGSGVAGTPAPQETPTTGAGGLQLPSLGSPTPASGAGIDVTRFETQDAPNTCDSIGWVSTSAGQQPATDADVAYRAACVGSGTWLATCGTMTATGAFGPEPGMQWVRCDFEVRAEGEPLTVSFADATMVDADGTRYSFDLLGIASLDDASMFPDAPIANGETGTGSVVFSVPADPATPLVVEIAPLALAAGEPGTLVIAESLQPFESIAP